MARHVGHLGCHGVLAVEAVVACRQAQAGPEVGQRHGLALDGVGHGVPHDGAFAQVALQTGAVGRSGLFHIFVDEPRARGPYVACLAAFGLQLFGHVHGLGDELLSIAPGHNRTEVCEAHVEVRLENHQNGAHAVSDSVQRLQGEQQAD